MFTGYLGLEVRGQTDEPRPPRDVVFLSQRFVLFCGGWWWAGRSHCHQLSAFLQGLGPMLGPRGLLRLHSHLKEAPGQEAGRQSYSLEDGRTVGTLEGRLESAHAEGPGSHVGVRPLTGPVPLGRVVFRPALGMGPSPEPGGGTWAPDPRSFAPSLPLRSERAAAGEGSPPHSPWLWCGTV